MTTILSRFMTLLACLSVAGCQTPRVINAALPQTEAESHTRNIRDLDGRRAGIADSFPDYYHSWYLSALAELLREFPDAGSVKVRVNRMETEDDSRQYTSHLAIDQMGWGFAHKDLDGTYVAAIRDSTAIGDRQQLLHELAHCFHMASTPGSWPVDPMYVEGLAEWMADHVCDGKNVQLHTKSAISARRYAYRSIEMIERKEFDIALAARLGAKAIKVKGADFYIASWAVVAVLQNLDQDRFAKWRLMLDHGQSPSVAWTTSFGGLDLTDEDFNKRAVQWLSSLSEPWISESGIWQLTGAQIEGASAKGTDFATLFRADDRSIEELHVKLNAGSSAGLLYNISGSDTFHLIGCQSGSLVLGTSSPQDGILFETRAFTKHPEFTQFIIRIRRLGLYDRFEVCSQDGVAMFVKRVSPRGRFGLWARGSGSVFLLGQS